MRCLLIMTLLMAGNAFGKSSFFQKRRQNRIIRCARAIVELPRAARRAPEKAAESYLKLLVEDQADKRSLRSLHKRCKRAKRYLRRFQGPDLEIVRDIERAEKITNRAAATAVYNFGHPQVRCVDAGAGAQIGFYYSVGLSFNGGLCSGNNGRVYSKLGINGEFGAGIGFMVFGEVGSVKDRIKPGLVTSHRGMDTRLRFALGPGYSQGGLLRPGHEHRGLGLGLGVFIGGAEENVSYAVIGNNYAGLRKALSLK